MGAKGKHFARRPGRLLCILLYVSGLHISVSSGNDVEVNEDHGSTFEIIEGYPDNDPVFGESTSPAEAVRAALQEKATRVLLRKLFDEFDVQTTSVSDEMLQEINKGRSTTLQSLFSSVLEGMAEELMDAVNATEPSSASVAASADEETDKISIDAKEDAALPMGLCVTSAGLPELTGFYGVSQKGVYWGGAPTFRKLHAEKHEDDKQDSGDVTFTTFVRYKHKSGNYYWYLSDLKDPNVLEDDEDFWRTIESCNDCMTPPADSSKWLAVSKQCLQKSLTLRLLDC